MQTTLRHPYARAHGLHIAACPASVGRERSPVPHAGFRRVTGAALARTPRTGSLDCQQDVCKGLTAARRRQRHGCACPALQGGQRRQGNDASPFERAALRRPAHLERCTCFSVIFGLTSVASSRPRSSVESPRARTDSLSNCDTSRPISRAPNSDRTRAAYLPPAPAPGLHPPEALSANTTLRKA